MFLIDEKALQVGRCEAWIWVWYAMSHIRGGFLGYGPLGIGIAWWQSSS